MLEAQAQLLAALTRRPSREKRRARFWTVAVAAWPDGAEVVAEGTVERWIALERRGGGFGYDPVFVPDEGGGATFAEMSATDRHALSRRGRAFRTLASHLR